MELILQSRDVIAAGRRDLPVELGLDTPPPHVERAEREVLDRILPELVGRIGPAARLIDIGPFAGLRTGDVAGQLERPKAIILLNSDSDQRVPDNLQDRCPTAEITVAPLGFHAESWDLPAVGSGVSLVMLAGGGLGLMTASQRQSWFAGAARTLVQGDFLLVSLEAARDGALMEAAYQDFGTALVRSALSRLGKTQGFEPRVFHQADQQRVRFGAIAQAAASVTYHDTTQVFEIGARIGLGSARQICAMNLALELDGFDLVERWPSSDGWAELVLFVKK